MNNKKVLVTYATRAGSTAEIAEKIGETLASQGAVVEVLPVKNVTDAKGYSAVVIGSGVRFSQWLPEAVKFLDQNQETLKGIPTAFFAVYLMNMGDDETSRMNRSAYLDPARKLVKPKSEAFFPGVGDMSKVSIFERMIGKAVKSPEGDFRDWQAIQAWAESLNQIL
jgi:menaquinone-dependent protoporphyrinogen oxidase